MPKARPKSVTHASSTASPLDADVLGEIQKLLLTKGFDKAATSGFLRDINGQVVSWYHIIARRATPGERRAWLDSVHEAIHTLRAILVTADTHDDGDVTLERSEDLGALDAALCRPFPPTSAFYDRKSATVRALNRLACACVRQRNELPKGVSRRPPGKRQSFANHLAESWVIHLGNFPTASGGDGGGNAVPSLFVQVLSLIVRRVEQRKPSDDAFRGIAQRAIEHARKPNLPAGK
jgi:hypothetical protein